MRDDSAEILFQSFLQGPPREQFWHGQGCPLFDIVRGAFLLPTTASSTLQGTLKDGFREVAVVCDMPESCKFLSLDSRWKRFPWTRKEANVPPHTVVTLVSYQEIQVCKSQVKV